MRGAAMNASLAAGRPVDVEELPTLTERLGGGIGLGNRWTFGMVRELVDEVVLLDEPEIAAAVSQRLISGEDVRPEDLMLCLLDNDDA
jgi:threonine dehydratase